MKFKVFISSRNNDELNIDESIFETMTDTRLWLKEELEKEEILGQQMFEILINEDFAADTSIDSYETCLKEVEDSDFTIAIVNGVAGWAPTGINLGICHAELDAAMNISEKKTAIIDVKNYYKVTAKNKAEEVRNKVFFDYLMEQNRFTNPLKLAATKRDQSGYRSELLKLIKKILHKHISQRVSIANLYYNISANNKISLDWKKMKYEERDKLIVSQIQDIIISDSDFKKIETKTSSIPDNMSVSDAKAYTGRPFLKDHNLIDTEKAKFGPIHFIGVYGNATEIQTKNLIGFPDLSVIIGEFGLYVWEQNTHIQLVFLTGCKTPSALKSKYLLFKNWCTSSKELNKIENRAEARFNIMKSILDAESIANK